MTLEIFDNEITFESKNLLLANGDVDELSFNLQMPLNTFNKNELDFFNEANLSTSNNCLVQIGDNNNFGKINIDSLDVQNRVFDATVYPNKQVTDFLTTPIRELLKDNSDTFIRWTPFCFRDAFILSEFSLCIPAHHNPLIREYANGANSRYSKSESYLDSWYNPQFIDDDFVKYQTKGCGAYKDYMFHPQIQTMNLIEDLNLVFCQMNNLPNGVKIIDVDSSVGNMRVICGEENISPFTNEQWVNFCIGERNSNSHTTYQQGGRYPINIELLGDHIVTQDSDDYSIIFDRNCSIQFEKIHLNCETTIANQGGNVELVLYDEEMNEKMKLFSIPVDNYSNQFSTDFGGLKDISYSAGGSTNFHIQNICIPTSNYFTGRIINVEKGDCLRLVISVDATESHNAKIKYLSTILKFKYVADNQGNTYEISKDDFSKDLEYWSGIEKTDENIDAVSDFLRNTESATWRELRKRFDKTLSEILVSSVFHGTWSEFFTKCYYGCMANLGELTPLKLMCYIAMSRGLDLYLNTNGLLKIESIKPIVVKDANLLKIDYLSNFGQNNFVKYKDDSQKLVGVIDNKNSVVEKVIFEVEGVTDSNRKLVISQIASGATISRSADYFENLNEDYEFKSVGNWYNYNRTEFFDLILRNTDGYSYEFEFFGLLPNNNFVDISGLRYLVLERSVDIANEKTTLKCLRF